MMSRLKIFLGTCILLLNCLITQSQEIDLVKKQINSIKKDTETYIYGESTAPTENEATATAEEILYDEVNKWAQGNKARLNAASRYLKITKLSILKTPRGNMMRCLCYVRKADLEKVTEGAMVTPAAERKTQTTTSPAQKAVYPDFIREVAGISDYPKLDMRLTQAKQQGTITDYARNAFPANPEQYYFAIYNPTGRVIALLTPGSNRINIRTGEPDSLSNYKGNKAVGFKL